MIAFINNSRCACGASVIVVVLMLLLLLLLLLLLCREDFPNVFTTAENNQSKRVSNASIRATHRVRHIPTIFPSLNILIHAIFSNLAMLRSVTERGTN